MKGVDMDDLRIVLLVIVIGFGLIGLAKLMQHAGGGLRDLGSSGGSGWMKVLFVLGLLLLAAGWLIEQATPPMVHNAIPRPTAPTVYYPRATVDWRDIYSQDP
jgi:hypothetical protein